MRFRSGLPLCVSCHLHGVGGEQPVDCFPITFNFLEKTDSCTRCGPPSCCPLSPISHLLPAAIPFPASLSFSWLVTTWSAFPHLLSGLHPFFPHPQSYLQAIIAHNSHPCFCCAPQSQAFSLDLHGLAWAWLPQVHGPCCCLPSPSGNMWQTPGRGQWVVPPLTTKKGIHHLWSKLLKTEGRNLAFTTTTSNKDQIWCSSEEKRERY